MKVTTKWVPGRDPHSLRKVWVVHASAPYGSAEFFDKGQARAWASVFDDLDTARRIACEITALARDGEFDGPSVLTVATENGWHTLYLDRLWPPRGPCAFCDDPNARHRLFDTIASRHAAGESVHDLASDYETTDQHIRAAIGAGQVDA